MISVLIVCRKVDNFLLRTINSVDDLSPQIIVGISESSSVALGKRKNELIQLAKYDWILFLDTDEVVSKELLSEIIQITKKSTSYINGYRIRYQNHIFGKRVFHGGEKYSRIQLFRKNYASFSEVPIHEHPVIQGTVDNLNGVIHHYSYVTLPKVLLKFTKYAWQMAGEKKKAGEGVTLKKLFLYGPHMVWARAIKDEGWRDGWRGVVIALCFGYMETLMYWLLLWRNIFG